MILYAAIAIILLIYLYFKKKFSFWKNRGFLYLEPSIPLGSTGGVGYKEHFCDFTRREYNNFKNKGPAFGIYMFTRPAVVLTDPELIKDVLVRHFENFHERGFYVNEEVDPLWKNLFTAEGHEWKDLRAKLSPTFTSGRIKMMFPIVAEAADRMVDYLLHEEIKKDSSEVKEIFASFTTEVIGNTAFGLNINCIGNPDNTFRKMAKRLFEPSKLQNFQAFLIFAMPEIAKFFNLAINPKFVTDFFMTTVRDNLEYREKNNIQRNDFFQLLINIKNSEVGMNLNEIAANCFIFFAAGFETSSSVMAFCAYELALNQDIQDRLRNEIEEVLKRHNGEVTYDAIMEMKYLDMVFNESMRKYPIIDTGIRHTAKDYKIPNSDLTIQSGVMVLIPTVGLQNDERYWDDPDKFDPERFSDENVKKRNTFSYIPFSEGPRICIGLRFGVMQTKIGLVKLLQNFKILPCSKTLIPMKYSPAAGFQTALGGMWLKIDKLN